MKTFQFLAALALSTVISLNLAHGQDENPWVPIGTPTDSDGWYPTGGTQSPTVEGGTWIPVGQSDPSQTGVWVPVEPTASSGVVEDFFQRLLGSTMIATGVQMVQWGLTTTGVLVADDATVIGVVDDPLILATGTTAAVGGLILIGGGVYLWIETVLDN